MEGAPIESRLELDCQALALADVAAEYWDPKAVRSLPLLPPSNLRTAARQLFLANEAVLWALEKHSNCSLNYPGAD